MMTVARRTVHERRRCNAGGVPCSNVWITDDHEQDATGEPLVRGKD